MLLITELAADFEVHAPRRAPCPSLRWTGLDRAPHRTEMDRAAGERRRGMRVRQSRPVKVFEPIGARYFGGRTEDISATGLRIELPAWATVRPGEALSIHVGLNRRGDTLANRRQMIPAKVVWIRRRPDHASTLEAGVEFLASITAHLDAA